MPEQWPQIESPVVRVYTLGGFRVIAGDRPVEDRDWRRRKARQLFKVLVTRPGRRMTRDEAVELFWPDSDPDAADSNLRSTVYAMRRALESAAQATEIVFVDRDSIWLLPDARCWVDADAFEDLARQAERSYDNVRLLDDANDLYAGEYLPDDLYEDWATERREALKRTWTTIQFERVRANVVAGRPEAAISQLQRLLTADRCDERAAQELMQILIGLRRRSEALRVFNNLEEALREELGVEPSDQTRDLHRQATMAESDQVAPRRAAFVCAYTFPEPRQLIGRALELAHLQTIIDRGKTTGQAVLITAPAGTGKSALAGAVMTRARRSGVLCLAGAAYDERATVPLAAFQEAFTDYVLDASANPLEPAIAAAASELIEAVRELRQHASVQGSARADASEERSRLFAAVLTLLRRLADRGPVLVCLEDLHVADVATLHLLHYLVRQTHRAPIVFVATLRSEGLEAGEPVSQVVAALTREKLAERVDLRPLDQRETDRLITTLIGGPISGNLSASVYAATEGNPLFVEQLVLALSEAGRLSGAGVATQQLVTHLSSVPIVVRELVEERLARLSPRSRETLETAAVLGQAFEYTDLLAVIDPPSESDLLADLDDAIRAQLVRERPTGFIFSHSLLRESVYWSQSRPRRMLLHGRAGHVLEDRAGANAADMAAELAHHFALDGAAEPVQEKALQYSMLAGRQAAALASHREALHHFQTACELIERGQLKVDTSTYIAALEGRGLAEDGMGLWPACIVTFRLVLTDASEPVARAHARRYIAFALHHMGQTAEALVEIHAGLAELGNSADDDPDAAIERLVLQYQLALLWFLAGRFGDVLGLGLEMVKGAERIDNPRWLGWAHSVVGWAHTGTGRSDLALQQYEKALTIAENHGATKIDLAGNRTNLGLEYYRSGNFAEAQQHLERSVAQYREAFSDLRAVLALQGLGWVHLGLGAISKAQEYAELSTALASEAHDRWLADCLELAAVLHMLREEWTEAEALLERVLEIRQKVGVASGTADALLHMGSLHECLGNFDRAQRLFRDVLDVTNGMDACPVVAAAHRALGLSLLRAGEVTDATHHIEHAVRLVSSMPDCLECGPAYVSLALLRWRTGELEHALDAAARALACARAVDLAVQANAIYAQLLAEAGTLDESRAHASMAHDVAARVSAPLLSRYAQSAALYARVAGQEAGRQAISLDVADGLPVLVTLIRRS